MCEKFFGKDKTKIVEDAFLFWGKNLSGKVSKRDFIKNCQWRKYKNESYLEYLCTNKDKKWKHYLKKKSKNYIWKTFLCNISKIKKYFVSLFTIGR